MLHRNVAHFLVRYKLALRRRIGAPSEIGMKQGM
jgi:hypothetical protein